MNSIRKSIVDKFIDIELIRLRNTKLSVQYFDPNPQFIAKEMSLLEKYE